MSSLHRVLPLLLLLLLLLSSASNSTDPSQCTSLLNIKRSFTRSLRLATWQPATDCCRWTGVTCDTFSGLVTALNLGNLSISGNLSTSLFNLTSLEKLNLAYNMFDGIGIPNGFQFLVNLTYLNLSNSGFVGQVPLGIGTLRKLEVLDLSSSYINDVDSLLSVALSFEKFVTNLSNLRELYLDTVNISRNGVDWCGALSKFTPKLTNLSLSRCSISGPIDPSLGKLRNLSVIRLKQNNLNCALPEFFVNFSSLRVIDMSSCNLNGNFPESVFLLKNLVDVDLSSNMNLSGSLPEFDGKNKLRNLVIANTKFSGHLPESIGYLNNLIKLDFSKCEFEKNIPSSVKNLSQLVYLDLSDNNLSGTLPSVLPLRLSMLNLANNRLTGTIPSYIGKLQNLIQIDMSNNSISGQVPVSLFLLPSLQVLKLYMNKLSGPLLNFSNMSSLTTIYLNNNNLQGNIPRSLFRISSLSILTLGSNNFSGIVELDWFSDLKNLTSLDLSHNSISVQDGKNLTSTSYPSIRTLILVSCNLRKVPSFLKHQGEMYCIDLSDNKITGSIPKWIWSIGNNQLNYLNLSHNLFTSIEYPLPKFRVNSTINNLDIHSNLIEGDIPLPPSNTAILDYSNNYFSSSIPSNISLYLSFTVFFSLANNNIIGRIPPAICSATYLQVLDFSNNSLNGSIPSCLFQNNSFLLVLNLRNNLLGGLLSNNVSKGCPLMTIDFSGNQLEGTIPNSLLNCDKLEILNLGNNQMTDTFPSWIAIINSLQVLVLRSNYLFGPVKSYIKFPSLQIIDIASNRFSGPLSLDFFNTLEAMKLSKVNFSSNEIAYLRLTPTYYQNLVMVTFKGLEMQFVRVLTIFTSLDFSNNQFEGSIPNTIGGLIALDVLNFSKNAFTGYIPASIGNLKNLESLDLSVNHLSGEIPQTISNLTFLSYMNLSYNNLVGKIPYGSQLSTFLNSSYEGNKDLCGFPLTNKCGSNSDEAIIESTNEVNWEYVLVGLGFGSGLATIVGVLMSWEEGRYWYNEKIDDILHCTVFWLVLKISCYFGDRRVVDENRMDYDCKENGELSGKKFCVFCTKVELYQGKARIHHVECDCL